MEKIKAACLNCRKAYSGTVEKLKSTPACPACGAQGNWWGQVETRIIRKERMQAEQARAQGAPVQWQPPPPQYSQAWAPLSYPTNRVAVLVLGVCSILLSPLGLILGPIGFLMSRKGVEEIKQGTVPSDSAFTVGWILCVVGFFISILGSIQLYLIIEDLNKPRPTRYETPRSPYGWHFDEPIVPRW